MRAFTMIRSLVKSLVDAIARAIAPGDTDARTERITNGGFDSAASWVAGVDWAIADGVATSNGGGNIYQGITEIPAGRAVRLTFTASGAGGLIARAVSGVTVVQTIWSETDFSGTVSILFVTSSAFDRLDFKTTDATGLTIDDVSLFA